MQGNASLEMQLVAKQRDAIVRTIEALSKSPAFGHVDLKQEAQPEAATAEPIQFSVSCHYEPAAAKGAAR